VLQKTNCLATRISEMANLGTKDGIFVVRFRYQGRAFKRSLKTRNESAAQAALHIVELTLHRLLTGQLTVGEGVDVGDFIVSGGTWTPPPAPPPPPPIFPNTKDLIERFLEVRKGECAPTYLDAQRYHFDNFKVWLGAAAEGPCDQVTRATLVKFLQHRKKSSDGETVNRYRVTLTMFYNWLAREEDVPPFPCPAEDLPKFKGSRDPDKFRTIAEVEATIQRGGLDEEQVLDQWEAVYLNPTEIAELLALVRQRATDPMSFLVHVIPAYSGMRRGELLRLRWSDVDLDRGFLVARSRKQSRRIQETSRQIDLHPDLKQYLLEWQRQRTVGQFVLSSPLTWQPLNVDLGNRLFWQPMRGTEWCLNNGRNRFKLGFHTYRHSFASNLAAAGVVEPIIDAFMGHQTEAMRKRYRHLFPKDRRSAILALNLSPVAVPPSANNATAAVAARGVGESA